MNKRTDSIKIGDILILRFTFWMAIEQVLTIDKNKKEMTAVILYWKDGRINPPQVKRIAQWWGASFGLIESLMEKGSITILKR